MKVFSIPCWIYMMGLMVIVETSTVYASENSQKLTACMMDNTTTEHQQLMQRWAFSVISSHPDMQHFFSYTYDADLKQKLDKQLADTLSDILLGYCKKILVKTVFTEGLTAVKRSATTWGKSSLKSMLDHPQVQENVTAFVKYIKFLP